MDGEEKPTRIFNFDEYWDMFIMYHSSTVSDSKLTENRIKRGQNRQGLYAGSSAQEKYIVRFRRCSEERCQQGTTAHQSLINDHVTEPFQYPNQLEKSHYHVMDISLLNPKSNIS